MGDRTWVNLTIRAADKDCAEEIINAYGGYNEIYDAYSPIGDVKLIDYYFYEINYAELGFESSLMAKGVPFDKQWGAGSSYSGGVMFARISDNGKVFVKEFEDGTEGMVSLDEVIKAFQENLIAEFIQKQKEHNIVMSWDEQEQILKSLSVQVDSDSEL